MSLIARLLVLTCLLWIGIPADARQAETSRPSAPPVIQSVETYDVVVVGGTPGGIMTAIAAAEEGRSVVLLERTGHVGGLPANGLGATDIGTRGATGGLFMEFVNRVYEHYVTTYGKNSPQVEAADEGYHFEPSVAEKIFEEMLGEHPEITVLRMRQFDALPERVTLENGYIREIRVLNRETDHLERYRGDVFIDATYEGDLAAAAGVPYRLGREGKSAYNEPMAGRLYKYWGGPVGEGSTGLGDNGIQAYNYRLPLTKREDNMVPIPKPDNYDREEYVSLIEDVWTGRHTGAAMQEIDSARAAANERRLENGKQAVVPGEPQGMQRIVNKVVLPNGKTDANNQHLAFISTDLPEENWPWPTSGWDWRDRFAERLKEYTLGLLWFAQHDDALPEEFREKTRQWGLAADEYEDNNNFPRQVYVREGRRIEGEHLFTAHDALPTAPGGRPPIYKTSITGSHYNLDSHAIRKREPGRVHLDGFFSYDTEPYTVPYGVMVPVKRKNLLTPVPVSGTHIGFSTLRMEPCWMAMGQAAGVAASMSIAEDQAVTDVSISRLQQKLLEQDAVLMYYRDTEVSHPNFEALQFFGVRGFIPGWNAHLDDPIGQAQAEEWMTWSRVDEEDVDYEPGQTTRGEFLQELYDEVRMRTEQSGGNVKVPSVR